MHIIYPKKTASDWHETCLVIGMNSIETTLKELGYQLPPPPQPGGHYLPYRISGNQLFISGVIAIRNGVMTHIGQAGKEMSVQDGYEAAQVCALNVLAGIFGALGSLDRVTQFLYVGGYVNAISGFDQSPQVINGASDLFVQIYGDRGQHARAAVAVAGLPKNSTVEIQSIVEFT